MKRDKWTVEQIPDLSGKIIIVTGANAGIGFEASKEFLRHGADFYGPGGRKEIKGFPVRVQAEGISYDPEVTAKLWSISEQLTGVRFL